MRDQIEALLQELVEKDWQKLEEKVGGCLPPSRLEDLARQTPPSEEEKRHLQSCALCRSLKSRLSFSHIGGTLSPHELQAAAGASDLFTSISEEVLEGMGFPPGTRLVCDPTEDGFFLRFEGDVPLEGELVFFREGEELHRIRISEQFPGEKLPKKAIESWDEVKFFRLR